MNLDTSVAGKVPQISCVGNTETSFFKGQFKEIRLLSHSLRDYLSTDNTAELQRDISINLNPLRALSTFLFLPLSPSLPCLYLSQTIPLPKITYYFHLPRFLSLQQLSLPLLLESPVLPVLPSENM